MSTSRYYLTIILLAVVGVWSCYPSSKEDSGKNTYQAPRHVGQIADQKNGNACYEKECKDPKECSVPLDQVSAGNPFQTPFNRMINTAVFAAVVDMDYDYTNVGTMDYKTGKFIPSAEEPTFTPLKVLDVKDVLINRFHDMELDGPHLYFEGNCNSNGMCKSLTNNDSGGFPFPIWSGVNLVVGRMRICSLDDKKTLNISISDVFPIENGYLYDYVGRKYPWEDMKKLIHTVKLDEATIRALGLWPSFLNCEDMVDPDNPDSYIDTSHNDD